MKNALEIFTEWVKENIKSTGDFYCELYERLTNKEEYTIFINLRQVTLWLNERYHEAAEAQWNNLLLAINKIYDKINELCVESKENADLLEEVKKLIKYIDCYMIDIWFPPNAQNQYDLVKKLIELQESRPND